MGLHFPRFGYNLTHSAWFEAQVQKSFASVDVDKDGELDNKEVYIGLLRLYDLLNEKLPCHVSVPAIADIDKNMATYDMDKSGKLAFPEYLKLSRALIFTRKDWRSSLFLKICGAVALKAVLFPVAGMLLKKGIVKLARDNEKVKKYLPAGLTTLVVEQTYSVTGQRAFPI